VKTGEDVRQLGLYMSDCCEREIIFGMNDVFSRCPACERLCRWELQESLVSWEDLEKPEAA